jgi:hypothetical protein
MKLYHLATGRWTRVNDVGDGMYDSIQAAANRLVERVYGRGYYAHRAVGWDNLPPVFIARVCRAVGNMSEDHGSNAFHLNE